MNTPTKVSRTPTWLKVAATIACCIAFSYIAIKAILGIIGLIVAGVLCLFSFKLGPVLAEYLDNLKMKWMKQQAIDSPIPTLENQSLRYHAEKETKRTKLEEILGKLETVKGKHEAYAKKYPDDTVENEKNTRYLSKATTKVEYMKREFQTLVKNVVAFDKEIEKAADKWEVALTMHDFDLAGQFNNDPMELIRSRTALGAVEDAVNKSMASMEVSLLEDLTADIQIVEIKPRTLSQIQEKS